MKYKVQLLITQLFSIAQKTKLGIIVVSDAVFSFLAALLALVVTTDLVWKDTRLTQRLEEVLVQRHQLELVNC